MGLNVAGTLATAPVRPGWSVQNCLTRSKALTPLSKKLNEVERSAPSGAPSRWSRRSPDFLLLVGSEMKTLASTMAWNSSLESKRLRAPVASDQLRLPETRRKAWTSSWQRISWGSWPASFGAAVAHAVHLLKRCGEYFTVAP